MQEQNGTLAEKLRQAEAKVSEAELASNAASQDLMRDLEQANKAKSEIQVVFFACRSESFRYSGNALQYLHIILLCHRQGARLWISMQMPTCI